jgi:hypothetical protein
MVFERIKKLVGRGADDEDTGTGGDGAIMPTNSKVIKKTAKRVDISRGDVKEAVENFQELGAMAYPAIDERAIGMEEKGDTKMGEEGPSFLYVIHEDEDVLVVGGAKSTIVTFAGRLNLSNKETEAVTVAHRTAAKMNGLSEHTVMDDIFMVPKREKKKKTGAFEGPGEERGDETQNDPGDSGELEDGGLRISASEVFDSPPDVEEEEYFGVSYGCKDGAVEVTIEPDVGRQKHRAVVKPNGDVVMPREIAVGLGVEHRDVDWEDRNGKAVGRMRNGSVEKEAEDLVRTSLSMDNIEEDVQAYLPDGHVSRIGVSDGDEAAVKLEPDGDELVMVLSTDTSDVPPEAMVEIRNIGTGTDMLCFAVPEEIAGLLGVDDEKERQVEWGINGDEMVGSVVPRG